MHSNIHTTVYPSYNFLSAENSYLKQAIEYRDYVLHEQQGKIEKLQSDVDQLSQSNMTLKIERDKAVADAERWRVMKQIIRSQGSDEQAYIVQKVVDKDMEKKRSMQ